MTRCSAGSTPRRARLRAVALAGGTVVLAVTVGPAATPDLTPATAAGGADCPPLRGLDGPPRVLFVGDSMTHGRSGSASYRYWVWRGLDARDVDARFVGPRVNPNKMPPGTRARDAYEHVDHGFVEQMAHAGRARRTFLTHPDDPTELARRHRPDVVVLQLGYNDANRAGAEQIADRTERFVERVWAVDERQGEPRTRFVLGQIPRAGISRFRPLAEKNAVTDSANTRVARRLAEPCVVEVNDLRDADDPAWDPAVHTYDGTHPTAGGETLMAQRMLDALRRLGAYREPVRVLDPSETWDPRPAVQGRRVDGHRWLLRWGHEQWRVGADRVRLRITPQGGAPRLTAWLTGASATRRLQRGTRVQLVGERGGSPGTAMTTEPGPALRVP